MFDVKFSYLFRFPVLYEIHDQGQNSGVVDGSFVALVRCQHANSQTSVIFDFFIIMGCQDEQPNVHLQYT